MNTHSNEQPHGWAILRFDNLGLIELHGLMYRGDGTIRDGDRGGNGWGTGEGTEWIANLVEGGRCDGNILSTSTGGFAGNGRGEGFYYGDPKGNGTGDWMQPLEDT